jgi:hypothetical protein
VAWRFDDIICGGVAPVGDPAELDATARPFYQLKTFK